MTKFLEIDFNKSYGKPFTVDGITFKHYLPWWKRPLYRITVWIQYALWRCGYSWHNSLANECTPDFSCCRGRND